MECKSHDTQQNTAIRTGVTIHNTTQHNTATQICHHAQHSTQLTVYTGMYVVHLPFYSVVGFFMHNSQFIPYYTICTCMYICTVLKTVSIPSSDRGLMIWYGFIWCCVEMMVHKHCTAVCIVHSVAVKQKIFWLEG